MANLSDATITVKAVGCLKEFLNYVDATNAMQPYYNLLSSDYEVNEEGENSGTVKGYAVGRWAWVSNLWGYFDTDSGTPLWITERKTVFGFENDNEHQKEENAKKKARDAFTKLVKKLREAKGAKLEFTWNDFEAEMDYFVNGKAEFDAEGLLVRHDEELEITPEALVKYEHFDTADDAKEALGL